MNHNMSPCECGGSLEGDEVTGLIARRCPCLRPQRRRRRSGLFVAEKTVEREASKRAVKKAFLSAAVASRDTHVLSRA